LHQIAEYAPAVLTRMAAAVKPGGLGRPQAKTDVQHIRGRDRGALSFRLFFAVEALGSSGGGVADAVVPGGLGVRAGGRDVLGHRREHDDVRPALGDQQRWSSGRLWTAHRAEASTSWQADPVAEGR
jgi:hypothetical protein